MATLSLVDLYKLRKVAS